MRAALGLSSPERRIGQTAHDFAQAMGHHGPSSSRARKNAAARRLSPRGSCCGSKRSRRQGVGPPWVSAAPPTMELAHALDRPLKAPKARDPTVPQARRRVAADQAQRHPHRDAAPRPVCDLRFAHPADRAVAADRQRDRFRRAGQPHARRAARLRVRASEAAGIAEGAARQASGDPRIRIRPCPSRPPPSAPFAGRACRRRPTSSLASMPIGASLAREITTETTGKLDLLARRRLALRALCARRPHRLRPRRLGPARRLQDGPAARS